VTPFFCDPVTGKWHKRGATSDGDILEASGEVGEGVMHLSGTRPMPHRSILAARTPHEVQEKITEMSAGEGSSWTTIREFT
jgi:hypothetical protein